MIHENKWRTTRFGLDADIIIDESGNLQSLKGTIIDTIEKLLPITTDLKYIDELSCLGDITENNNAPYNRQIMKYNKNNDYTDIIQLYIRELENGQGSIC